ncbi:MAG: hypothetical protein Q9227_008119 [Pyrenula ochraceoflavens]
MATVQILRLATRAPSTTRIRPTSQFLRRTKPILASASPGLAFSTTTQKSSGGDAHAEETFEEFTDRYVKEFEQVQDVFELQRNLNNCFAYDLVPSPLICEAALKAARRVNDFPTAVRLFEGIQAKVENTMQYQAYLEELKPLREEFGVPLKEEMYPGNTDSPYYNP